jgi:type II secretory pathway component PulK
MKLDTKKIKKSKFDIKRDIRLPSKIDEKLADRVADWIDPDSEARLADSETNVRNANLISVDEIKEIKGIKDIDYDTLLPYVTVYGDGRINVNGADKPVLMSMSDLISDQLAQRVIEYRKISPFEEISQLQEVAGFELTVYGPVSSRITVKGKHFSLRSTATSGGMKRIIVTVLDSGPPTEIKYWKEY